MTDLPAGMTDEIYKVFIGYCQAIRDHGFGQVTLIYANHNLSSILPAASLKVDAGAGSIVQIYEQPKRRRL